MVRLTIITSITHFVGKPIIIAATLAEMEAFGGSSAECLVDAFTHALDIVFAIPDWRKRLVSMTSDGASVNLGVLNGFLIKIAEALPWLIKIHCANHRIELAFKHVFKV